MKQPLAAAYKFNPTPDAARARLRALDETVTQARGGYRPTIVASGTLLAESERKL